MSRCTGEKLNPNLARDARALRSEGLTITGIAVKLGIPRSTVGDLVIGIRPRVDSDCVWCGREFGSERSHHPLPQYCSVMCRRYAYSKAAAVRRAA